MSQSRCSPRLVAGILLILFFGVALCLRIALPYGDVFSGDWIKLTGVDAYRYMRLVDNLAHNFPHLISFDPYMRYPYSLPVGGLTLFVYLLSGIAWLVGLGSPTQHTVDVVGIYFPAIIGALTVIPVYFIGKALFNRWAGIIAAGLIAIFPGEFLGRSILGFTDRDAVEVLFTVLTMLFLILAIKIARQKQLTFNHVKHWDWTAVTKPLIYSLLAGISLGIYLLTWRGAFIFVFVIFVYFVIQSIIDHLKHNPTDYLCFVGTITFFVALIMFLPASPGQVYLASLVIALLTPLALAGISRLMVTKKTRPAYYPLALTGLGLVGLAIFYVISPSLLSSMLGSFRSIFAPSAAELTVLEQQPLLFPGGNFSPAVAWGNLVMCLTPVAAWFLSLGVKLLRGDL